MRIQKISKRKEKKRGNKKNTVTRSKCFKETNEKQKKKGKHAHWTERRECDAMVEKAIAVF